MDPTSAPFRLGFLSLTPISNFSAITMCDDFDGGDACVAAHASAFGATRRDDAKQRMGTKVNLTIRNRFFLHFETVAIRAKSAASFASVTP